MTETRRRPGPAPRLSREAVLEAARSMPPDEVTLAALGAKLGVTSPALYRYFDDRTAILEALAVEAREQLVPPPADLHWEDWVREAAARERALWRTHPDLYESARYRAISAPLTRLSLAGLRVLIQAGFTAEAALAGMTVTSEIAHSIGQAETKKQDPTYLTEEEREEFRTLLSDVLPMSFDRLFESSLSLAIEGMRSTLPRKKR